MDNPEWKKRVASVVGLLVAVAAILSLGLGLGLHPSRYETHVLDRSVDPCTISIRPSYVALACGGVKVQVKPEEFTGFIATACFSNKSRVSCEIIDTTGRNLEFNADECGVLCKAFSEQSEPIKKFKHS